MLNLAFSSNAFKKNTLEDAIETIASIGYRGVELMADVPHAYPPDMAGERIDRVRRRLRELNLRVSNINAFTLFARGDTYHPTWIESDPAERQLRIDHTLSCITLARAFESPSISIQPGGPLIGTDLTVQQAAERFAEGLRAILPTARETGIILAIEPEPGLLIQSSSEYIAFKSACFPGEPLIRMNCDLGHLFCVGDDPAEVIRSVPAEIAHIHLEDIGKNRVHQHLVPGRGVMDFPHIFAALREIGYKGWITVELYPFETTAAGVAEAAYEYLNLLPQ